MKHFRLAGSTAAIALFAGSAVWADVTPEDVWQSWQDLYASSGQTVATASSARQGDTLVIEGLAFTSEQPEARTAGKLDRLALRDKGDGTVEITLSDSYSAKIEALGEDGAVDSTTDVTVAVPGLTGTASGTPGEISYDFAAPAATIAFDALEGAAAAAPFKMTIEAVEPTGKYLVGAGVGTAKDIKTTFAATSVKLSGTGTQKGNTTTFAGTVADVAGTGAVNLLDPVAMADLAAAVNAGFLVDGSLTHGAFDFTADVADGDSPGQVAMKGAGGELTVALDKNRVLYTGASRGVTAAVTSADIPFPITLAWGEASTGFQFPVAKTGAPGDFSALVKLVDLTVSEELWSMFDPGKTLPRDPATLIIDAKGQLTLKSDLLAENAQSLEGQDEPDLNSLSLNELRLTLAGAELTGTGDFTFDNADKETFGGMPAPTGKLSLGLTGGNGLLDKLVALGFVPEDQAMQVRMMTAMFAVPGAGADALTSEVEFKDKGLFVNGQRLQ